MIKEEEKLLDFIEGPVDGQKLHIPRFAKTGDSVGIFSAVDGSMRRFSYIVNRENRTCTYEE